MSLPARIGAIRLSLDLDLRIGVKPEQMLTEAGITHKRDPASGLGPYRPQTNGKVERFNRTKLEEWAYAQPYTSETERAACLQDWIHTYNLRRSHTRTQGQVTSRPRTQPAWQNS